MELYNKTKEEVLCTVVLPELRHDKVKCLANTSDLVGMAIRWQNEVGVGDDLEFHVNSKEMVEIYWRMAMRDNIDLFMNGNLQPSLFFCEIPLLRKA